MYKNNRIPFAVKPNGTIALPRKSPVSRDGARFDLDQSAVGLLGAARIAHGKVQIQSGGLAFVIYSVPRNSLAHVAFFENRRPQIFFSHVTSTPDHFDMTSGAVLQ